jgi:hypothetical protein
MGFSVLKPDCASGGLKTNSVAILIFLYIYKEFYLYLDLDLKNSEEPMQRQPGARRFAAFF